MSIHDKLDNLKEIIKSHKSAAVAFSGGVDSTFLLKVASEVLGDRVVAVTAHSSTYPERELQEAIEFCRQNSIHQRVIISEELDVEGFSDNPVNRCYLCKNELYDKIKAVADEEGMETI
ncbi:MAG TPA: TIGR00268 family protein, partial [Ruminiclostridium sp.]|nr:TIGR00268 family protein [Ruminiclostridium sp.]